MRNRLLIRRGSFERDFRLRGKEVSRIESFSDAVFAFAITLVVVSLQVPTTFMELEHALVQGLLGFAICFVMLVSVWYGHYRFFRRYGLHDAYTILLNAALLFVILFYIYPLKFLFTLLAAQLLNFNTANAIKNDQWPSLLIIYGAGFVAVYTIFLLLYIHAYRKRAELELNDTEVNKTQDGMLSFLLLMGIGSTSIAIAAVGGERYSNLSGWTYIAIIPLEFIAGYAMGRYRKKVRAGPVTSDEVEAGEHSS